MTVIVDTGIFFAFYSLKDKHHLDSLGLIAHLVEGRWGKPYITNHILGETLNILKYRLSPETANAFLNVFINKQAIDIIFTDEDLEAEALKLYGDNLWRKGFSYTDAITVAVLRNFKIDYLLSYDIRSFEGLVDRIIGVNYWNNLSSDERKRILKLASRKTISSNGN